MDSNGGPFDLFWGGPFDQRPGGLSQIIGPSKFGKYFWLQHVMIGLGEGGPIRPSPPKGGPIRRKGAHST